MPKLIIRATNNTFTSVDEGSDYDDVDAAMRAAVRAGIDLVANEMHGGAETASLELIVEKPCGDQVARGVVSMSVSRLRPS